MHVVQLRVPGGPEVLEWTERPLPQPGPGEVRVRARAIGVSGADALIRAGTYPWMPPLPAVPGNEMAGVVDALGPGITSGLHEGHSVLVSSRELPFRGGCYAEAICVPADSVYLLPESIPPIAAVTLPNYQLAGAMLYESGVTRPSSILIHGAAGGVATAVIQLAMADGIRAIGTVSTPEKAAFARAAGAPDVLVRHSVESVREAVMALTGGHGVDVVFAASGKDFATNLDLLAPLGTVVSFSVHGGPPGTDLLAELRKRQATNVGIRVYSIHSLDHHRDRRRALMQRAIDLMAAGRLVPPAPTVLPLAEARRAHELLDARSVLGKLVLVSQ
jgi:NADPH2:quinone reductase